MTDVAGLFSIDDLEKEVDGGYITVDHHPAHRLYLLNYTSKAAFDARWNDVTLNCRGLVIDQDGGLVARPWPKFFDHGSPEAPDIAPDQHVVVTDKVDGSLGILFKPHPSAPAEITTRGRFYSIQGRRGTEILREKYPTFRPPQHATLLFEIVYPENQIIVDYGDTEDLILLGGVDKRSGKHLPTSYFPEWPGPRVEKLYEGPFETARFLPQRPNREGVVVHAGDLMVKIKQDDYRDAARLATQMNAKLVWEELGKGRTVEDLTRRLPGKVVDWVEATADDLLKQSVTLESQVRAEFAGIIYRLGASSASDLDPKTFAAEATQNKHRDYLFLLFRNKPVRPLIWKNIKPSGDATPYRDEE